MANNPSHKRYGYWNRLFHRKAYICFLYKKKLLRVKAEIPGGYVPNPEIINAKLERGRNEAQVFAIGV